MPVRVLFQDESRFGRISDQRRCWGPCAQRATVAGQIIRESVYALAAVSPADGELSALIMPWVNAETMSVFLAHTAAAYPGEFCVMFLDAAGWPIANDLRIPHRMSLAFLPPYSPELNPVEHLWDHIRENDFGNHAFATLDDVETRLCEALSRLMSQLALVRSLTSFDWMNTL